MSSHEHSVELDSQNPSYYFSDQAGRYMKLGFIVGLIGLAAGAGLGMTKGDHLMHFMHSYLTAYLTVLAVVLGCLFFVTLQHLTRAGWSVVVRRLAETIAGTMPVMAILALPIILPVAMGSHVLYEWVDTSLQAHDHLLQHKAPYLNAPFFLIRMAVFFGLWIFTAHFFAKRSAAQDASGDPKITWSMERFAPLLMAGFALSITYGAIDLIMSLEPHWYSTIIGVYYFGASMMVAMAALILLGRFLQRKGKLEGIITTEHYHDLGKLLFAFVFFWSYIAFSQFMLIWYANIPEGTMWYQARIHGQWYGFSLIVLVLGHFAIPFLGLISRQVKRHPFALQFWAVWMLVMHWFDMYYLVMPTMASHGHGEIGVVPFSLIDILNLVGMAGMLIGAIFLGLRKKALIPLKDPRLAESLGFENA